MTNFKHKTPIQLRFKDMDMFGHVNNANHLTYIELARVNYLDDVLGDKMNWLKKGIIIAQVTIDYKMPVLFKDHISIYTKCSRIGNKSFDLSYSIVKDESGKEIILADAFTVLVCYDYEKGTSVVISEEWKKRMRSFDNP